MNPHRDTQEQGDSNGKIGYNEDRRESFTRSKAPTVAACFFKRLAHNRHRVVFVCV